MGTACARHRAHLLEYPGTRIGGRRAETLRAVERVARCSLVLPAPIMCLYDGLLPRALSIFELPSLRSGQRGIVIGMGGGCDVLGALAFAQAWEARSPGGTVLFANCVSPRPMPSHEQLAPHLWRCPPNVVPLAAGDGCYGSTRLEQSLPRGAEGVASGVVSTICDNSGGGGGGGFLEGGAGVVSAEAASVICAVSASTQCQFRIP